MEIYMIKIAIVSDGHYAAAFRTYKEISSKYKTKYIQLDSPGTKLADEIPIDSQILDEIRSCDLLVSYIWHPDLAMGLIEQVQEDLKWIIVATWYGEGFKNQLIEYENVKVAGTNNKWDKIDDEVFDEFIGQFGSFINRIYCNGTRIVGI